MLLTVFENMKIAADLKLGYTVSRREKNSRVCLSIIHLPLTNISSASRSSKCFTSKR